MNNLFKKRIKDNFKFFKKGQRLNKSTLNFYPYVIQMYCGEVVVIDNPFYEKEIPNFLENIDTSTYITYYEAIEVTNTFSYNLDNELLKFLENVNKISQEQFKFENVKHTCLAELKEILKEKVYEE